MNGRRLTIGLAFLAALPLLYIATYFAFARHSPYCFSEGGAIIFPPTYEPLPAEAWRLFKPIHWVDSTWIRPRYWRQEFFLDLRDIPVFPLDQTGHSK